MNSIKSSKNETDLESRVQVIPASADSGELDEWFEIENLPGNTSKTKNKLALLRRKARSVALQTLFEVDATRHTPIEVVTRHIEMYKLPAETAEFAQLLVEGVNQHKDNLDGLISRSAPNWPIEQMPKVDKNILRLAIFEILFNNDVPTKAAIDEAIELAKNFGSDSSSSFVNGVLGAIVTHHAKKQSDNEESA